MYLWLHKLGSPPQLYRIAGKWLPWMSLFIYVVMALCGGMVADGSVSRPGDGLTVQFDITDNLHKVRVSYKGILPDLFREGQGIIANGRLDDKGSFVAQEVLAKHDENYMPPEVSAAMKAQQEARQ